MIKIIFEVEVIHVWLLWAIDHAISRSKKKIKVALIIRNNSPIFWRMVKGAFKPLETFLLIALGSFVNKRMELLLFPPVAIGTFFKAFATFFVASNEGSALPIFTKFGFVAEKIRFSSKILEVVCINTLSFIMFVIIWAPFSLKKEYVEVKICLLRQQIMN